MDVGDDTTAGDGRLDEGVELLVTADGELEVAGRDALDLEWVEGGARGKRGGNSNGSREKTVAETFFSRREGGVYANGHIREPAPGRARDARTGARTKRGGHLEILGRVAGELENLGGEVLCADGGEGSGSGREPRVRRSNDSICGETPGRIVETRGRRRAGRCGRDARRGCAPRMAAE